MARYIDSRPCYLPCTSSLTTQLATSWPPRTHFPPTDVVQQPIPAPRVAINPDSRAL